MGMTMARLENFDQLLQDLQNGSPNNPDAAWQAAIELGAVDEPEQTPQAVTALISALTNPQSHALIRAHAVESLGRIGNADALDALRNALNDPYRLVRAYSAGALSNIENTSDGVDVLISRLPNETFFGARAEIVSALVAIALRSSDVGLRQRVREILEQRLIIEQTNLGAGVQRVIADIERGLQRLDQ
jgi:HEAT repeat protein